MQNIGLNINKCTRCNRNGHCEEECYATTYENGETISDNTIKCQYCQKQFDTQKGATYHENFYCQKNDKIKKSNTFIRKIK